MPEKRAVYDHIYAWLREQPTEETLRRVVRELTTRHRVDMGALLPRAVHGLAASLRRSPPIRW